jgi:hypothetical protein
VYFGGEEQILQFAVAAAVVDREGPASWVCTSGYIVKSGGSESAGLAGRKEGRGGNMICMRYGMDGYED